MKKIFTLLIILLVLLFLSGCGPKIPPNNPPNVPSNPTPFDNATGVPIDPILSWACSDPDGDPLVYDIYFGTSENNLSKIVSNHATNNYQLQNLSYNTTYYWKIVAKDSKGTSTSGPVWKFTTTVSGDVAKAKALVSDLRNTILTIHDYKGIGVPGIVDTPFQNLSQEIQEKIVPDLSETVMRIGFIMDCTGYIQDPGTYYFTYTDLNYNVEITFNSYTSSIELSFKGYKNNTKIDEGSFIYSITETGFPTFGNLNATMQTKDGNLSITGNFNATQLPNSGFVDTLTITGRITSPYLKIDFSQAGRKFYINFGEFQDSYGAWRAYLENLQIKGQITTTTAQAEGSLDVECALVSYPNGNTSNPPKNVTFTGTFREMKNGSPTGAYFTGTISGQYLNYTTYNPYESYGQNNYPQWKASFNGHIEAPKRPKIDAYLEINHETYQIYVIKVGYERKNSDNTVVWLKTPDSPQSIYNESNNMLDVTLENQDGLMVKFTVNLADASSFQGEIKNNLGVKLAELYVSNGIPMVKYQDGYIESIF